MNRVFRFSIVGVVLFLATAQAQAQETANEAGLQRDCVINTLSEPVVVWITSAHIGIPALHVKVLSPGQRWCFSYVPDGKQRVLSAFSKQNDLICVFPFEPIDACKPGGPCLLISHGAQKASRDKGEPTGEADAPL